MSQFVCSLCNQNIEKNLSKSKYIIGRKTLLQRCINNLLDNALKYSKKIRIELKGSANGLFINICDRVILGASDGRIEEHVRP